MPGDWRRLLFWSGDWGVHQASREEKLRDRDWRDSLRKIQEDIQKKWKEILKQHSNWGIEQLGGKTFVDTDWTQSECTLGLQNANAATLYRQLSCKKAQAYLIKVAYSEQQNSNLK